MLQLMNGLLHFDGQDKMLYPDKRYRFEGSIKSNSGDKASLAAYYFSEILLCYMFGYYHDPFRH